MIRRLARDTDEGEKVCVSGPSHAILALVLSLGSSVRHKHPGIHRWPFSALTLPTGPSSPFSPYPTYVSGAYHIEMNQ